MAPGINLRRFVLSPVLLLFFAASFIPQPASARPLTVGAALPDLPTFAASVENGIPRLVSGVYARDVFALPVVQQGSASAGYVSTADNTVTQFDMAAQFGNVGLLAHNYLSGQFFFQLRPGHPVYLVYGDGRLEPYWVTHVFRYQATEPFSPYSSFIDLVTGEHLAAGDLFVKMYQGPRHVTFQTCIANQGNSSWGRLFVIAEPVPPALFGRFPHLRAARPL